MQKDKKTLEDTRTFSASVRTEFLNFSNYITIEQYEYISTVRKARNAWIHDLKQATLEISQSGLKVAQELVHITDGVYLNLLPCLTIHF